jgi:hypothetical protein
MEKVARVGGTDPPRVEHTHSAACPFRLVPKALLDWKRAIEVDVQFGCRRSERPEFAPAHIRLRGVPGFPHRIAGGGTAITMGRQCSADCHAVQTSTAPWLGKSWPGLVRWEVDAIRGSDRESVQR